MVKSGVVLSIEKNKAVLFTKTGEFAKVKVKGGSPKVGETFSGEQSVEFNFFKYPVVAASIVFFLLIGTGTYAYYSPAASVVIDINPSIKLSVNRWDKIISTTALNNDGEKVLGEISLKNKSLNDGLMLIVDEAKRDNFINDEYINTGRTISVYVTSTNHKNINLSNFQNYVVDNNINLRINADGKEIPLPKNSNKGRVVDKPANNGKDKTSSDKQTDKDNKKDTKQIENPKNPKTSEPGNTSSKNTSEPKTDESSGDKGKSGNSSGSGLGSDSGKSKEEKGKAKGKNSALDLFINFINNAADYI